MGTREDYLNYIKELDEWFKGTREHCIIEVLIRDDEGDRMNMFGAYLDSLKTEGTKLSFTTVHDDKNITIHLTTVAKVTIIKEKK